MFKNYLTEIISKKDWRHKAKLVIDRPVDAKTKPEQLYRKKVTNSIDFKEYKSTLPELKKVFKELNGGVFKSTLVFDFTNSNKPKKFSEMDHELIEILKSLDYEVSEESYSLGFVQKKGKTILVNDILNGLDSKNTENMQKAYEKSKNPAIKKQLDAVIKYQADIYKEQTLAYKIAEEKRYKIVLSIQPRLIASQSTKVGWTSCMNLNNGELNDHVGMGMANGVIIAYATKTGDEHALDNPSGRVLMKPFRSHDNLVFDMDATYGTPPSGFEEKVKAIFEKIGRYLYGENIKPGTYKINANKFYLDEIDTSDHIVYTPIQTKIIADFNVDYNFDFIKTRLLKESDDFKKHFLKDFMDCLEDSERLEIVNSIKTIIDYDTIKDFGDDKFKQEYYKNIVDKHPKLLDDNFYEDQFSRFYNADAKKMLDYLQYKNIKLSMNSIYWILQADSDLLKQLKLTPDQYAWIIKKDIDAGIDYFEYVKHIPKDLIWEVFNKLTPDEMEAASPYFIKLISLINYKKMVNDIVANKQKSKYLKFAHAIHSDIRFGKITKSNMAIVNGVIDAENARIHELVKKGKIK